MKRIVRSFLFHVFALWMTSQLTAGIVILGNWQSLFIAGFILSIGMAVDANILIFERMKEERRAGRSLQAAIDEGFRRAWTSVRDSNISSLITAAILFYFGTGLVRGFALTLAIGIAISMFTAVFVTRTLLKLTLRENKTSTV